MYCYYGLHYKVDIVLEAVVLVSVNIIISLRSSQPLLLRNRICQPLT